MGEDKETNNGIKVIGYLCAGVLILTVLFGALDGIDKAMKSIPWYGMVVLSIGFCFILYKITNK